MIQHLLNLVGMQALSFVEKVGSAAIFFGQFFLVLFTTRFKLKRFLEQVVCIGVDSLLIAVLTGTFTGMVFALQCYVGFQRIGGEQFIGAVVAHGLVRELGPVLTGLIVTGRAGSAIAAELGTMSITEQIDALKTLQINPIQYLIVPRIIAGTLVLPLLAAFAMFCGIVGGYFVSVSLLDLNPEDYTSSIRSFIELSDIVSGLIKAMFFGFLLSLVGTYKGYFARNGARGVGQATTQTVVVASVLILISNYFLTKMLEQL